LFVQFAQSAKVASSQVVADPETSEANHVIQYWLASGYEPASFGFGQHSQKAGNLKSTVDGYSPAAFLVNQKQIGVQFTSDDDGFGLAGVEFFAQ
jgi:hypothetical protein